MNITGLQKAAILMLTLGAENAGRLVTVATPVMARRSPGHRARQVRQWVARTAPGHDGTRAGFRATGCKPVNTGCAA